MDNYIEHSGKKGMKWGHHNYVRKTSNGKPSYYKPELMYNMYTGQYATRFKKLTDKQAHRGLNRIYRNYHPFSLSRHKDMSLSQLDKAISKEERRVMKDKGYARKVLGKRIAKSVLVTTVAALAAHSIVKRTFG